MDDLDDVDTLLSRRKTLTALGTGLTGILAGCAGNNRSQETPKQRTDTIVGTADSSNTPSKTPTPTGTPSRKGKQEVTGFDERFGQKIDQYASKHGKVVSNTVLKNAEKMIENGNFAEALEYTATEAAKNQPKKNLAAPGAEAAQVAIHHPEQGLGLNTDQTYTDIRRWSLGGPVNGLKLFNQVDQQHDYTMPWGQASGEDTYLKGQETPQGNTEQALAGLENPSNGTSVTPFNYQKIMNIYENDKETGEVDSLEDQRKFWASVTKGIPDILPGKNYGEEHKIASTISGIKEISDREMNYQGIEHIIEITTKYDELEESLGPNEFMLIDTNSSNEFIFEPISNYTWGDGYIDRN